MRVIKGSHRQQLRHVETPDDDNNILIQMHDSNRVPLACENEIREWSFVDDQSEPSDGIYRTRNVPWPSVVRIRVSRRDENVSCPRFRLNIIR